MKSYHFDTQQVDHYQNQGFLLLPDYLSKALIDRMYQELPKVLAEDTESTIREEGQKTIRATHGTHLTNDFFARVTRHPRLLEPAKQLLGGEVYVHQFKINTKAAMVGDVWAWHQDYIFWQKGDGMPAPNAVTVGIFMDDVVEYNGPLYFIPGTQAEGVVEVKAKEEGWHSDLSAQLHYALGVEEIKWLADKYGGLQSAKGPAGTALFFHPNLVHGSPPNISPYDRAVCLVTYNRVDNKIPKLEHARPEFIASHNSTPLSTLSEEEVIP